MHQVYSIPPDESTPTLTQWGKLRELRRYCSWLLLRQQSSRRRQAVTRGLIAQIDRLRFADSREGQR